MTEQEKLYNYGDLKAFKLGVGQSSLVPGIKSVKEKYLAPLNEIKS